ncbi:MAG: multidrug resistance protein family [Sphingomonadales bacterium]|jgi:MATE family multidrug resistance protein|nr:multidrug resistance protein family [Sphingomonadales bacterium]
MDDNRGEAMTEARRIVRLAWPIMLTSLNWTLMHMIDVAVVGHYGTAELAALAASRILTFISIVIGFAGLSGILVHTSRADGGGRLAETGDIFRSGLILGLILGLAISAMLGVWAFDVLALAEVEPSLRAPGAAVVRAMALAFPFQFLIAASSYFLEGISRPRRVMTVNLTMLPVNALLAWAWVGGHFGLPAMGAVGAAYATATTSALGAVFMLALVWLLPRSGARGVRDWTTAALRRALAGVPGLAWFGLMPAIGACLELAGFSWLMVLSTQLGLAAAGAFQAMLSIHNIAFALSMGFGSAAGVRVGNAIGAGERGQAWPRAMIAAGLCALLLGLGSLLLVFGASFLVWPFSDDPQVLSLTAAMLSVMGAFLVFDGLQYVFGAALRSLGEQVWASLNGIIGFFVVTGGLGWLLVRRGWGPDGLAYAAGAGMLVCALLQFGRFAWVLRKSARSSM